MDNNTERIKRIRDMEAALDISKAAVDKLAEAMDAYEAVQDRYNALLDSGIPFRYEPVITVIDEFGKETSQSPDFLIKCPDDSYIAIEHLGMLASGRYAYRFSVKLQNYIRSGFVPGENLILTSDNMNGGFDCRVIERSIAYIRNRISGIR